MNAKKKGCKCKERGGRCKEKVQPKQNKWCALLYLQDVEVRPNGNVYPHSGVGFAEL